MSTATILDEKYMRRALELAELGRTTTAPNPVVGCVIVYKGRIIGEGWHKTYGGPHAEVNAVNSVKETELLPQSTAYVSLEPCVHHGKTPPCADLLIAKGIPRIVVALRDPNPRVNGGGFLKLEEAGHTVVAGVLENEARSQNRRFLTRMIAKRPYVVLKWAQTADGFVARENGDSKWISNPQARQWVHRWRAEESAILVGSQTVRQDNPSLTVRDWSGPHPTRIILDRSGTLSTDFHVFDGTVPTRWYTQKGTGVEAAAEKVVLQGNDFLSQVLNDMHQQGLSSVFVEGGTQVLHAFISAGLWDEARIFTAPTTFGAGLAAPLVQGMHISTVQVGENQLDIIENEKSPWRKN